VDFVFTAAGSGPVVARDRSWVKLQWWRGNIGRMLSSRAVEDCGGVRGKRVARKTHRALGSKKA
jgi:hypothetical protein